MLYPLSYEGGHGQLTGTPSQRRDQFRTRGDGACSR